jgi:hypothetical protein
VHSPALIAAEVVLAAIATVCMFAFGWMSTRFVWALKQESPALYESFGSPRYGFYIWNKRWYRPFSRLIVLHGYRQTLIDCPKSRAWASWLFFLHWMQVISIAAIVLAAFTL